ncbi:MAG: dihydrofolate reductase, partial [Bacteroidaceae bacterium]|nr:dihydrofolate reductase [Bacteroidaceae bacterium]
IEEAHMRNRALIAYWVLEKATAEVKGTAQFPAVELLKKEGKTYVQVNDYLRLRSLFGELLAEIQRIRSTGDFDAARELVEQYGVSVNPILHKEVLVRYKKLNLSPYKGFINPVYKVVQDAQGSILDVKIDYTEGYAKQMLRYSRTYSHLN